MSTHERVIHFFMAICFMVASVCTLMVARPLSGGPETLLWLFDLPVIAVAANALRLAFGRAAQE